MKAEAAFFIQQNRQMGIWIDFYESKLTDRVINEFIEFLKQVNHKISKLGIVGCSTMTRLKLNRHIKKTDALSTLLVKYFDDPEAAKAWLVSELE